MLAMLLIVEDVSALLMMLKDYCRSAFQYCVVVCVSRFLISLPLSDRVPVALGGKDVLAMLLIEDVSTLLMMLGDCRRSAFQCRVVICVSRLPLPPLFSIAIAIVGSRSGYRCCCCGVPVAGWKDIMVTKMLIEKVPTLLMGMTVEDC